jgi:hypothetical protein
MHIENVPNDLPCIYLSDTMLYRVPHKAISNGIPPVYPKIHNGYTREVCNAVRLSLKDRHNVLTAVMQVTNMTVQTTQ